MEERKNQQINQQKLIENWIIQPLDQKQLSVFEASKKMLEGAFKNPELLSNNIFDFYILLTKKYVNTNESITGKSLSIVELRHGVSKKLMRRTIEIEFSQETINMNEMYKQYMKAMDTQNRCIFEIGKAAEMYEKLGSHSIMFRFSEEMKDDIVSFLAPDKNDVNNLEKLKQQLFGRTWNEIFNLPIETGNLATNQTNQPF